MLTSDMRRGVNLDMKDVAEIIDALGGNAALAGKLGVTPSGVSEMKRRGRIPPRYWLAITKIAAEDRVSGISLDVLATIAADTESNGAAA